MGIRGRPRLPRAGGVVGMVAVFLLAGCADSGAPAGIEAGEDAFAAGNGAIAGSVVDEEFFPVADATVGIADEGVQTVAADDGRFLLRDLRPGTHSVQVLALGFRSVAQRVDVVADETTQVDVVLTRLAGNESYVDVVPYSGLVRSITWRIGSTCETIVEPPLGTCLGYQPSSLILFHETEPAWEAMIGELIWEPNSAVVHQRAYMFVTFPNVTDFSGVPDFESPGHFETGGESPQTLRIDRTTIRERGHPEESHWGRTRFRALNNFDDVNASGLAGVSMMFDQPMDMYWSFFYRQLPPDAYTVLPDQ